MQYSTDENESSVCAEGVRICLRMVTPVEKRNKTIIIMSFRFHVTILNGSCIFHFVKALKRGYGALLYLLE